MRKLILFFFCIALFNIGYGQNYKVHLDNANEFLKTFDKGYYGYLEISDGYLYDRYQSGKYSKVKISDLNNAIEDQANRKVVLVCKGGNECVFSTYTDSYHKQLSFSTDVDFNTSQLISLLNNLIGAYTNAKVSPSQVGRPTDVEMPELQETINTGKYLKP